MTNKNDNRKRKSKMTYEKEMSKGRNSSIENDPTPENNPFYGESSHKNS